MGLRRRFSVPEAGFECPLRRRERIVPYTFGLTMPAPKLTASFAPFAMLQLLTILSLQNLLAETQNLSLPSGNCSEPQFACERPGSGHRCISKIYVCDGDRVSLLFPALHSL